ncbi:ABC-type Fe3+ transport system [Fusarium agapanthi]|uniref:ABC-type Fe3+ transport system n=1 Tax=Fusarium agapanthi TaxID=1803897 RepID=A0A9P5B316_9HYPO|nr:ABC-type Fe3+ transport system [Fusarium agapanthi]
MRLLSPSSTLLLAANAAAYGNLLHFGPTGQVKTRSINQIYKAAVKEGGVVTAWFGGDEKNQNDATTQDFTRWKEEGALLHYAPAGFDKIYSGLKDTDAAFYGYTVIAWQLIWNADKLKGKKAPAEYSDFLAPEYKGKLALTYPNDDDSILFLFDRILNQYGESWFNKLLQQKPRWVRGAATPQTLVRGPKTPYVATFTSTLQIPRRATSSRRHSTFY